MQQLHSCRTRTLQLPGSVHLAPRGRPVLARALVRVHSQQHFCEGDVNKFVKRLKNKFSHDTLTLTGYLFEVHVWASFNWDGMAKGLPYRAQLWEDGGGGAVDIRVFDTSDPDTTLLEAQLKVRPGTGSNNKTLFSRRYKGMDRITTTEHVDIRKGVEVSDTLCYGGAKSLPLSVKELQTMCKDTKAHFKRVKAAVRERALQEGW